MNVYHYWTIIGCLTAVSIFIFLKWFQDRLGEGGQVFVVIFTIVLILGGFLGIPSCSTLRSKTSTFEVKKINKTNANITLYVKGGYIVKLKRAKEGVYLWENDTIVVGDTFNLEQKYNYFNIHYEDELKPLIK